MKPGKQKELFFYFINTPSWKEQAEQSLERVIAGREFLKRGLSIFGEERWRRKLLKSETQEKKVGII